MAVREDPVRGQSSLIGLVLVIGMVLAGATLIVALGSSALSATERQAELERAEHSMTLFDSRTSMVALGDSPTQRVSFGRDNGAFVGAADSGWLRIVHANYTGQNDDETLFNASLGALIYQNGNAEIAYQGGGVWRNSRQGETRMVSPPEFHYRGATLTLPIIRIDGAESGSGSATATISRVSDTRRVFPNVTSVTPTSDEVGAPYNGTDQQYTNPVGNGTVNITVKSDYYQGWAEYFRERTEGNVTEFPKRNQVRITLISLAGSIGDFPMPAEGENLGVRGMGDEHPISEFTVTLAPDPHFQNMHWSFYVEESGEQFELHFFSDGQCTGGSYNGDLDMSIYYYNSSGPTTLHEEWQNQSVNVDSNPDFNVDCASGNLTADLMGSTPLTYDDIAWTGTNNKWYYQPEISDRDVASSTTSFTHTVDAGNFSQGQEAELGFLINHYFTYLSPQYDLTVTDGPGGSSRVDESSSEGTLVFDTAAGPQYVTFLHVTENRVTVRFD